MFDHVHLPPRHSFISILITSVLISTSFGFVAGFLGGDENIRTKIVSAFSSNDEKHVSSVIKNREKKVVPKEKITTEEEMTIMAVQKASPAVVSIVISKDVPVYEQSTVNPFSGNELFQQFFGNQSVLGVPQYRQKGTEKKEVGAGSGFLVSTDGYIVTNKHVVQDEKAEYVVVLQDKRKFTAKILIRDSMNDIAVLKIDGKGFPKIAFGDSDKIKVGQRAIAIGYALGRFGNTVSYGIISGLQRSIEASDGTGNSENLFGVIQTDAAINPGNSGGPLLNLKGEVIGVDVAIVQGSQSIGFALPINGIRRVVDSVRLGEKLTYPFLGIRYVMINKNLQDKNKLPVDYGALVVRGEDKTELSVMPGSPADVAGIVENDIVLEMGGQKLTEDFPPGFAIQKYKVGEKVKLKVLHKGVQKEVEVTFAERK